MSSSLINDKLNIWWQRTVHRSRCWFHSATLNPRVTRVLDHWNRRTSMPLGDRGELEAERFLLRQGMVIVGRKHEDWFGEIDLIAVDGRTLVFVEVKTRKSDWAGLPVEAVDQSKQDKLIKTATGFIKNNHLMDCQFRFDIVSIIWRSPEDQPELSHYRSAFEPKEQFQLF